MQFVNIIRNITIHNIFKILYKQNKEEEKKYLSHSSWSIKIELKVEENNDNFLKYLNIKVVITFLLFVSFFIGEKKSY